MKMVSILYKTFIFKIIYSSEKFKVSITILTVDLNLNMYNKVQKEGLGCVYICIYF